jgi:Co/Zn/Cd efflux system component
MDPAKIHYDGMIMFAIVGVGVNLCAAFVTREGDSLNQKAVNLHMLEDVLGWIVVLIGAIVMRFTDFALLDPIMSIGVSLFILINALRNLKEIIMHPEHSQNHHGHHHHGRHHHGHHCNEHHHHCHYHHEHHSH